MTMTAVRKLLTLLTMIAAAMVVMFPVSLDAQAPGGSKSLVYVGTYNERGSKGIYGYRFDSATGKLTSIGLVAESDQPSFLAADPRGKFLFAVNEIESFKDQQTGAVSSFRIDRTSGKLTSLGEFSSRDRGPAHLALDNAGKHVLVANYTLGSVAVLPIEASGILGTPTAFVQHRGSSVNPERQQGPHAHAVVMSKDDRFAVVADLGIDQVLLYPFNKSKGTLGEPHSVKTKPGAGPRHLAFHPNGRFLYVANELHSTVVAYSYDGTTGRVEELQSVSTLPEGYSDPNTIAEIVADKQGKYLYVSNRGDDSIAVFAIDPASGTLRRAGFAKTGGKTPRNFAIDPTGKWLLAANQNSDNIVVFRISPKTGLPAATGEKVSVPAPVCVLFVPLQ